MQVEATDSKTSGSKVSCRVCGCMTIHIPHDVMQCDMSPTRESTK